MKIKNLRYSIATMGLALPLALSGCSSSQVLKGAVDVLEKTIDNVEEKERENLEKDLSKLLDKKTKLEEKIADKRAQIGGNSSSNDIVIDSEKIIKDYYDSGKITIIREHYEEYESEAYFLEVLDVLEEFINKKAEAGEKEEIGVTIRRNISKYSDETLQRFNKFLINCQVKKIKAESVNLENISFVSNVTSLKEIYFNDCGITDIDSLAKLTNLEMLAIGNNKITNIDALSNLVNLKYLNLGSNDLSNVESLKNLTKLEELGLGYNNISNIDALKNLTKLKTLILHYNNLSNIEVLSNLIYLETLDLSYNNNIDNLENLSNLNYLNRLSLFDININDISPLVYLEMNNEHISIYLNEEYDEQLKEILDSNENNNSNNIEKTKTLNR